MRVHGKPRERGFQHCTHVSVALRELWREQPFTHRSFQKIERRFFRMQKMKNAVKKTLAWLLESAQPSRAWRIAMLLLTLSGTICLALWAIEEATQTTSMAAWIRLKSSTPEKVHETLDVYSKIADKGANTNNTLGLGSPLSHGAYATYFEEACPVYEDAMRDAADAKKAGSKAFDTFTPKTKIADTVDPNKEELVELPANLIGETAKSWKVSINGQDAFLPKSKCVRTDTGFSIPTWLADKLVRAETQSEKTTQSTEKQDNRKDPKRNELIKVNITPVGETDKSWRFEVNGSKVYLPKSQCTMTSDNCFKVPLWLVQMKKLEKFIVQ